MRLFKLTPILLSVFFLADPLFAAPAIPPAALTGVCSAILYDLDHDAILFEQNPDQRIPPASLTKVMSMFLALDHVALNKATLNDPVDISPAAATAGGSRMGIRKGEQVSLKKLLLGMAISSGNDASHAVAEYIGGSTNAFVAMMNQRAKKLGMNDSYFINPHGMPAQGQFTTARDMLTLARAYLKTHPQALAMHNSLVLEHNGYKSWNKNPLIGQYPGADGLKTGWIRASGYNLVFTAKRNGRRLLAVILGAPNSSIRGAEACRLLDAGFKVCANEEVSVAAALDYIPVDLARIDPRKTAREHGIVKPAKHQQARKTLFAGNTKRVKNSSKKEQILHAKKAVKSGRKVVITRIVPKQKHHAVTKQHRSLRG